jgi:ferredoxin
MKLPDTITIIHQRDKCIGCNYCVEYAPLRWAMSRIDGKSILLGGVAKKGFWSVKTSGAEKEQNIKAAEACPVKVIQVIG